MAGDAAVGAIGDLEGEELGAGRDTVETTHAVQIVRRGDSGDVGAVRIQREDQIERRLPGPLAEVHHHCYRRRATPQRPAERLTPREIVSHRPLAGQGAVFVGVG